MIFSLFGKGNRVVRSLLQCINAFRVAMQTGQPTSQPSAQSDEDRIRILALIIERAEA
jgi:hypothetical protein